jgi:hypothetical protein
MDNFSVSPDPYDPPAPGDPQAALKARVLTPAPTLQVNSVNGQITGNPTPATLRFRDDQGRIKPVSPFFELWAQFSEQGAIERLTRQHLDDLGATVEWRVHVANLKPFRRTGDVNDQVHAVQDFFSDHSVHLLNGASPNFKAGKHIPFGTVQYLDPNSVGFPEVRLRFTPAAGLVYGPRPASQDPNVKDDVYDGSRGRWLGHFDGRPGTPPSTIPGAIYYGHSEGQGGQIWVSNGYLDDTCDGVIQARVTFGATVRTAFARVSVGPPTFAPDSYHPRTVADELTQIAFGPSAPSQPDAARAIDILRRSVETVRMLNTAAMNDSLPMQPVSNMARHDTGWGRAREPIFPVPVAEYGVVNDIHGGVLDRAAAGDFSDMGKMLRPYDRVGDLSNTKGRRLMPGMMRGSDGLHLALTRRQVDTVGKADAPAPGPGLLNALPLTPDDQLHALIDHFAARRYRHALIPVDGQRTLADLFTDKAALIYYLKNARVAGPRSGNLNGQPLIIPGRPNESALLALIRTPGHPMHGPMTAETIGTTGKTGLEILTDWIASL